MAYKPSEMSKKDLEEELWSAAGEGDVERVTRLIQQGVDVNCHVDSALSIPLHKAVSGGHVGVAELLLKAGAQIDSRDGSLYTPLHKAASGGHVGVTKLLLKAGAQIDSRDGCLYTPLHKAASGGHVGVTELLLKAGARVDSGDAILATPLHKAAEGGHVGVAELLLKAGARVDSGDALETTPLHNAASGGHVGVVELLLKAGARVDSRDGSFVTPLHKAALGGHVGVIELLLKAAAQVDCTDRYLDTPLHYAAGGGHVGVAELLLEAGARVDSVDGYKATPLHKATLGVELLLKAGAQVDQSYRSLATPLQELLNECVEREYRWYSNGRSPKDIAESTGVPYWYSPEEKARVRKGRRNILELFATVNRVRRIVRKLGPEGGELQTASCTVTVPPGAVTIETEITYQVIDPNDVTLPMEDGAMLVSDVIELGPHGTTFHQPVTVQMQYSSASSDGAREAVVWITEDGSEWTELKTTKQGENQLSVSVDHFSTFAVISQPKQDRFTVPTERCTLTSSTQPDVQISFPEEAVAAPTQVSIQVQEVPKKAIEDLKAKDQSSSGLVSTSPIVTVGTESDSEVQLLKPATVRVPHPKRYQEIQHEGPNKKLKVMSQEKGTDNWTDETENANIRELEESVEFDASHCTRWIVIVVTDIYDDSEKLGPIPLKLCRWLQHREVQFLLLQQESNANEIVIECVPAKDADIQYAALRRHGYKGPVPSDSVDIFEGQRVEISLLGNVSIAPFSPKPQITFHSEKRNRLHMQVVALEARGQGGFTW